MNQRTQTVIREASKVLARADLWAAIQESFTNNPDNADTDSPIPPRVHNALNEYERRFQNEFHTEVSFPESIPGPIQESDIP